MSLEGLAQQRLAPAVMNGFPIQLSEVQEEVVEGSKSGQRTSRIGLKYKPRDICIKCGKKHGATGKKAEMCRLAQGEEPIPDKGVCKHCGKKHAMDGHGKKALQCRQNLLLRDITYNRSPEGENLDASLYQSGDSGGVNPNGDSTNSGSYNKRRRADEDYDNLVSLFADIDKAHRRVGAIDLYGGEDSISLKADALTILERVKDKLSSIIGQPM